MTWSTENICEAVLWLSSGGAACFISWHAAALTFATGYVAMAGHKILRGTWTSEDSTEVVVLLLTACNACVVSWHAAVLTFSIGLFYMDSSWTMVMFCGGSIVVNHIYHPNVFLVTGGARVFMFIVWAMCAAQTYFGSFPDAIITFLTGIVVSGRIDHSHLFMTASNKVYLYLVCFAWLRRVFIQVCAARGIPWLDDIWQQPEPAPWGIAALADTLGGWITCSFSAPKSEVWPMTVATLLADSKILWELLPAWETLDWLGSTILYIVIVWTHGSSSAENRLRRAQPRIRLAVAENDGRQALVAVLQQDGQQAQRVLLRDLAHDSARADDETKRISATIIQVPDSDEHRLCPICFERDRAVLNLPCRHLMACRECHMQHAGSQLPVELRCVLCRALTSETVMCNLDTRRPPAVGESYELAMPFYCT